MGNHGLASSSTQEAETGGHPVVPDQSSEIYGHPDATLPHRTVLSGFQPRIHAV